MKTAKFLVAAAIVLSLTSCSSKRVGTLTFNPRGGVFADGSGESKTLQGQAGVAIEKDLIPQVTYDDKYFLGWFESAEGTGNALSQFYFPYVDVEIYAFWANSVTIDYVVDIPGVSVPSSIGYEGLSYKLPEFDVDNHTLIAWYSDAAMTTKFEDNVYPKEDLTLYAKFEEYPTLTLHYSEDQSLTYQGKAGSVIEEIIRNPILDGYTFKGWYTDQSFATRFYFDRMPGASLDLYPLFVKTVTVSFDSNGGSEVASLTGEAGANITAPTIPSKDYCTFDGWYLDSSLTTRFTFEAFPSNDLTLFAKWIDYPIISFTAVAGQTNDIDDFRLAPGTLLPRLPVPVVPGKEFLGWYYTENGAEKLFSSSTMPAISVVLTPRFVDMRVVTIHSQGGETRHFLETEQATISGKWWDDHYQTPSGYVQNGLFADPAFSTEINLPLNPAANLDIYVRLAKIVTINFADPIDDKILATVQGGAGMSLAIDEVTGLDRAGYEIEGFYTDKAFSDSFAAKLFPQADSTTIYIKYLAKD